MLVDEMIVVAEFNTAVEAEMAKNILACAGISARISSESATALFSGGVRTRLVVDKRNYRQAKVLLRLRE